MWRKWPKISQDATFAPTLNGHNSANFYPISTFDHTKMISSGDELNAPSQLFRFWSTFWSKASHGQYWVDGPKTTLKLLVHILATAPSHSSKYTFQKFWAWTQNKILYYIIYYDSEPRIKQCRCILAIWPWEYKLNLLIELLRTISKNKTAKFYILTWMGDLRAFETQNLTKNAS